MKFEFSQQNINQSEAGIGDKKLPVELCVKFILWKAPIFFRTKTVSVLSIKYFIEIFEENLAKCFKA